MYNAAKDLNVPLIDSKAQKPSIVYSLVACDKQVISEAHISKKLSNVATVMTKVLPKLPEKDGPAIYEMSGYLVCCVGNIPLMFIAVTDCDFNKPTAISYLESIQLIFKATYGNNCEFRAHQCGDFDEDLKRKGVEYSNNPPQNKRISKIEEQVNEVKAILVQNIEDVVGRHEKIEDLVDKSEDLKTTSRDFSHSARSLKNKYWCLNLKWTIILVAAILVFLLILLLVLCKPNFSNCS